MRFQTFHERWHQQLDQLVQKLKKAPRPPSSDEQNNHLLDLVNSLLSHLGDYYQVKSAVAHQDVLFLLDAPWASTFERSLHWITGWRPTTAFQVVHTKSTMLFENRMLDILEGGNPTGDLADLSPDQFKCLSDLQCDVASDMMLFNYGEDMGEKSSDLGAIVQKADELRMSTLRKMVQLLTPHQAVDFLISAASLHSFVCAWGLNYDGRNDLIN
ncbi:DOG1 domain-containing protein [Heracleum sosnowskyi]|uniref:DOG1 domain-containing protein n=1 Tax=Heracleum sosnowskyi TaxID=360622 RepID=A0AAD8J0P2_9APIA|nr:DOG1 domain-containing protein [Heracleum sosnowskyi]